MLIPPPLLPGHKIALCSTARHVEPADVEHFVATIQSWGFQPVVNEQVFGTHHQFGGTDTHRAKALQSLVDDPEIKAIFISKGGYGTVRIIDRVDFSALRHQPKWVCGYSDITVLHSHLQSTLGLATLHCPMATGFKPGITFPAALVSIKECFIGNFPDYRFYAPKGITNQIGKASGVLTGGNLSLLYALSGSISEVDVKEKMLFLEDIDEYLYHIDRMLWQLSRSGKLRKVSALIIGGFTDMKDNAEPFGKSAYDIIQEHSSSLGIPVAFGLPAGHVFENYALPLGLTYELEVKEDVAELKYRPL